MALGAASLRNHVPASAALLLLGMVSATSAWCQDSSSSGASHAGHDMSGMDHGSMPEMDHTQAPTSQSVPAETSNVASDAIRPSTSQGGSAPPDARDPNAFSGGYEFGPMGQMHMGDTHMFGSLLMDRLESVRSSDNSAFAYDMEAWYGRDYDRAMVRAEGDFDDGKIEDASTELLWSHAIAAYWNSQLGLRYDSGEAPDRRWLAFGVDGLAPYWIELAVTGYLGPGGRTALNVNAEYELLLTPRLILQPRVEMDFYGKDDPARGIGSGLSELAAGLRLRYEFRRECAPYVGIEWAGAFGDTADYADQAGIDAEETRIVAGLRFWF